MDSVYVHIPFCKSICSYCDFCKMLYNGGFVTQYLNALLREIKGRYNGEVINTLYVGGGTPSCLKPKELKYLMEILRSFKLANDYEFTFECNLNDINDELLEILKENGVNRLSIGIESFNEKKLKFMERSHTFADAKEKIALCRTYGFNNINVDLIYGIIGETLKDLKKDIELILKLDVEHISTYSLIIEDNTKIGIDKMCPIDEDLDADMYEYITKTLSKKYEHYEISNFAKSGYYSRHNMNYWDNKEYYGFGLGASGYLDGVRYENTRNLTKYLQDQYIAKQDFLSKTDIMDNEIMLGFRKIKGINLQEFFKKYEVNIQDVYDIKTLIQIKDLIYKNGYLFINPKKLYIMNEILIKLL